MLQGERFLPTSEGVLLGAVVGGGSGGEESGD